MFSVKVFPPALDLSGTAIGGGGSSNDEMINSSGGDDIVTRDGGSHKHLQLVLGRTDVCCLPHQKSFQQHISTFAPTTAIPSYIVVAQFTHITVWGSVAFLIRHLRQTLSFRARILSPTSPSRPHQTSFPSFRLTLVLVDFGPPWQQAFRILWVMDKTSDSQSPLLRFILALQTTCMTARPLPLRSLS